MAGKPKTPKTPKITPPKGFTAAKQADFVAHVREGLDRLRAAEKIDFEPREILDFIEKSADFRSKVTAAELEAVEQALFRAAMSGKTIAMKTWLEYRGRKAETAINEPLKAPEEPEKDPFAELDNVTTLRGRSRVGR